MEELTPELLEKYYKALPDNLRSALRDKSIENEVFTIGKKRGLHIDLLEILMSEVHFFILGATHPADFKRNISKKLDLDSMATNDLVEDLNKEIFLPIRESLQVVHGDGGEAERKAAKNFVTQKLNQTEQASEKTSDHSITRSADHDPYREPID